MTHSTILIQIMEKTNFCKDPKITRQTALSLIELISDIGFDYIATPEDALNYAKRINILKTEINNYYELPKH